MLMLQFTSARGPVECQMAVAGCLKKFLLDAERHGLEVTLLDENVSDHGYHSVVVGVDDSNVGSASMLVTAWIGTLQWIWSSEVRKGVGRKNWFIGVQRLPKVDSIPSDIDRGIVYRTCKASGKGGQHVNTTDSAVQAFHEPSGISVKVQAERSQHANKRLARELIASKLQHLQASAARDGRRAQRAMHWNLERGNPVRVFEGMDFTEK